ncbi:rhombosortase [Marinobacter sediminum]|uniref:rhombosortase n=1 Tax=Marinobacter sediminum TaxID=256323 RepID=UPI001939C7B1
MNDLALKPSAGITKPVLPVTLGSIALLVWALGPDTADLLRYQRDAVLDGQHWRLLTAHWVHLGWQHLAMNLGGLAVIWLLFGEVLSGLKAWVVTGGIALFTSFCLLLFHPQIEWYVGLSGLLHGLLAAGALLSLRTDQVTSWFVLLVLVGKLGVELLNGGSSQVEAMIGGPILVQGHLCGTLGGGLCAAIFALTAHLRSRKN